MEGKEQAVPYFVVNLVGGHRLLRAPVVKFGRLAARFE
jgi:hypothetical protein